jgi:hypothetical protein
MVLPTIDAATYAFQTVGLAATAYQIAEPNSGMSVMSFALMIRALQNH